MLLLLILLFNCQVLFAFYYSIKSKEQSESIDLKYFISLVKINIYMYYFIIVVISFQSNEIHA